jgi:hypothetical protein
MSQLSAINVGWPEGIYLVLLILTLGYTLAKDGQPKNDKYSFWATTLSAGLVLGLLYWGGFFS